MCRAVVSKAVVCPLIGDHLLLGFFNLGAELHPNSNTRKMGDLRLCSNSGAPRGQSVFCGTKKKKKWCVLPQITLTCARSVTVPALTLTEMSSSRGWRCKVGTSSPKWRTYYTVFRLREGGLYLCLGVARGRGAPPPEDKIGELWPSEWRQDPNQWPRVLRPHWSPSCLS